MIINVLHSPLDKGELYEKADSREIEVSESVDNRGTKPNVYLGICKTVGKNQKKVITEDFFLSTADAITIGKALIKTANKIEKDRLAAIVAKVSKKISKK